MEPIEPKAQPPYFAFGALAVVLAMLTLSLFLFQWKNGFDVITVSTMVAIAGCSAASFWLAAHPDRLTGRGVFMRAFGIGLVVGLMGFAGGFFGPIYFAPESNLGPLLGIFLTGPVGALGGFLGALLVRRDPSAPPPNHAVHRTRDRGFAQ